MKLATTTADFAAYYPDKSIAAPLYGLQGTGFTRADVSFYSVIYPGSPWIAPGDAWKKEVEDTLAAARELGLSLVQAHSPDGEHFRLGTDMDALNTATLRSIEACAMLSIPHTVVHAAQLPGAAPAEFVRANADFYARFESAAEKFGVDLLAENSAEQNCPGYYLRTGREMREFIGAARLPRLHLCWDIGHANMRGNDQYRDILDMGDELRAIHAQDNYGDVDSHVMPMSGTACWDDVLRGLRDIGYQGYFTFEGGNTLRRSGCWPHFRRSAENGLLADPPVFLQQKQIAVMHDIGRWMLESYGLYEE